MHPKITKGKIMKNVMFLLIIFSVIAGCSPKGPQPDSTGKVPADYAKEYYAAINKDDYKTLKQLYSRGYLLSITTKNGFLKSPDSLLFQQSIKRKMFKHNNYIFDQKRSGFSKTNADGVYSFLAKVFFTDEYKQIFEKENKFKADYINDEVCFKIENGVWRITDKFKGQ